MSQRKQRWILWCPRLREINVADKIRLDLNNPVFQAEFFSLEKSDLIKVVKVLRKISAMDWDRFVKHRGSRWELIAHIISPLRKPVNSFRLSQEYRALAYRDGLFLRVLSLHLDHDSAYQD
jgi:hypothetical protein